MSIKITKYKLKHITTKKETEVMRYSLIHLNIEKVVNAFATQIAIENNLSAVDREYGKRVLADANGLQKFFFNTGILINKDGNYIDTSKFDEKHDPKVAKKIIDDLRMSASFHLGNKLLVQFDEIMTKEDKEFNAKYQAMPTMR